MSTFTTAGVAGDADVGAGADDFAVDGAAEVVPAGGVVAAEPLALADGEALAEVALGCANASEYASSGSARPKPIVTRRRMQTPIR
jgi:hypothetical protein